jgi:UDP-N-acetylglucosamine transferase subunit ALG13
MILVTVGTEQFPFNRLMQWLELLVEKQAIDEELVVQYGTCTFLPSGATVYRMLKEETFRALIQKARVVIAHCGEGTVLLLDELQQPFILVPRSVRYQEHVDDHQVELALALKEMEVPIGWCPGDLLRFLEAPFRTSISDVTESSAQALCLSLRAHFPEA